MHVITFIKFLIFFNVFYINLFYFITLMLLDHRSLTTGK